MSMLLLAVVFVIGLFWRRATATGAFATLIGGHLVSATLFGLSLADLLSLHFTIVAGLSALASTLIFVVSNRHGALPGDAQVEHFTFHAASIGRDPSLAWWQDYRLYSVLLLALTAVVVIVHW